MKTSHLIWQCRRGVRELDVLLSAYATHCFDDAPTCEQSTFLRLVAMENSELWDCLLQGTLAPMDEAMRQLIGRIHACGALHKT